ncbi:competence/damage-inducible protein A [Periweissella beninensis]|uniref:Putative competence-damage inducible protein n=1 Tax=Periweissella beninensis TaxID=504936 RepID=A0ABT0VII1_9LACO|nr:competence/damage-inducible protein A [Periweissella beninensis]MBM7544007.1 nicotinamide-nucleotide amidase [Periweissella beninensis]MCM2437435.1 competence/damage-inducible protein A [Periweissella beninensis]MCT4396516.1 competence/damage-inducible protein A [Periweissella beninensis]
MQAEIIAVGTELLLGQIIDTNSPKVAQKLAELDINVFYQTTVGDNEPRLIDALQIASERADLIITIGGLGPTVDDLTKQTVAKFLKQELAADEQALKKIIDYHDTTSKPMSENNKLQALYLAAGQSLKNDNGFAVGSFYKNPNGPDVLLLPGPPWELEPMLTNYTVPVLQKEYKNTGMLISRVLRFFGIGESRLATKLADLIDEQSNPTIAPYAKKHEVTLRLTAQADNRESAIKMLDLAEDKIMERVGIYFYGYGDDNSLVKCLANLLIGQQLTISAAESLTAGLFQSTLATFPGISTVFPGGVVTYNPTAKNKLAKVPVDVIDTYGVVSRETAIEMAKGIKERLSTNIAISFTGVASGELEGHKAGMVWIGLAYEDQPVEAYLYQFGQDRQKNRERAVLTGLDLIRRKILNQTIPEQI